MHPASQAERQAHESVHHSPPHDAHGNQGSCAWSSLLLGHSRGLPDSTHRRGPKNRECLLATAVSVGGFAFVLGREIDGSERNNDEREN